VIAVAAFTFTTTLKDGTEVTVHEGDELPDDHELVKRDPELFGREPAKAKRAK
jgi:hypothetical protein